MFDDSFEICDDFVSGDYSEILTFDKNKEYLGEDSIKEDNFLPLDSKNSIPDSILNNINQIQGPLLSIIPEEKSTSPFTKIQETAPNSQVNNKIKENNEESFPLVYFYSFQSILNILTINNLDFKIIDKFTKGKHIENTPEYKHVELGIFVKNNRKLNACSINYLNKKRGRKITTNIINFIHDNMSPDNIIKKIKSKIFNLVNEFINKLLYLYFKETFKLLKTDYSYVNKMNQKENLEYLGMSLRDILSFDISKKYKINNQKGYNKNIIEQVEKLENTQTLTFALNLSLQDFMDIFCFIKKFEDFDKNENIDLADLKKSFTYCDTFLKKISDDCDDDYFAFFIFFIYNYKRWFSIKKRRNINKKEEDSQKNICINLNL